MNILQLGQRAKVANVCAKRQRVFASLALHIIIYIFPILYRCQNALYDSSIVIFVSPLAASLVALCARIRLICVFCCERLRQFVEQTFQSQPILW